MSTMPDHTRKQPYTSFGEVRHPLRSKRGQELIEFSFNPGQGSGHFYPGPAFLINASGKRYPVTLIGFTSFAPGPESSAPADAVMIKAPGLETLEDSFILTQE
jgi:hypothetical protein